MNDYEMKIKTITEHLFEDNIAFDVLFATINKIVNQNKELALDNMKMLTKLQYIKTVLNTENIEDKQKLYFLEGILRDVEASKQEPVIDTIRAELIQSIQNGMIKIESGNEELFRILDKYKEESKK